MEAILFIAIGMVGRFVAIAALRARVVFTTATLRAPVRMVIAVVRIGTSARRMVMRSGTPVVRRVRGCAVV